MLDARTVGKTIATLRQRKGMTQQALAASLNVTHQAVSRWENGITMPDMQTMLDLSHMFGVTIEQILSGEAAEEDRPGIGRKLLNLFGLTDVEPSAPIIQAEPVEEETKETTETEEIPDDVCEPDPNEPDEEAEVTGEAETADTEEAPVDEKTEEEPKEEAPSQKFDLNRILKIAPFMSKETLDSIVAKCADNADWNTITALAPFLSRETLRATVAKAMKGSAADRHVIVRLAPFLGSDLLNELLMQNIGILDWSLLRALAPFLSKDVVDRLALTLSEMPEAPENTAKKNVTVESVFNDVGKTLNDIGNSISNAVESAIKSFSRTPSETPKPQEPEEKPRTSERRKAALEMIIGKAIEEKNLTWLKEHVEEIDNPDLLNRIAETAVNADDAELFSTAVESLGRDEADIAAALAISLGKADWLKNDLEYITDHKILMQFAEQALERNNLDMFSDALVNLDSLSKESLCEKACAAENIGALLELLENGCSDSVLIYAVSHSLMDLTETAAENASDDALTRALEIALASSDWPIINLLTEFMD